ncbi:MAG TPA: deoxyribodipyrimidine photo-lyase [Phycisphaerae bacterium]|nr:deoxyribodipyrimidine photo-lyase [Phycisphaerae bacterium]
MWFRSDLRVQDNTALHHACRAADGGVIGIFAICPQQWEDHDWGSMKVDFVLRNVRALSESLAKLNIPLLLIRARHFAELPGKLLNLARRHKCTALHFNREYEVNELRRDREVTSLFEERGLEVHAYTDQVILDVSEIRTGSGGWYSVFTPFRRKWCNVVQESGPPTVWPRPRRMLVPTVKPDRVPATVKGFSGHRRPDLWPEGERIARRRLQTFVSRRIGQYDRARDFPATDGTSTLSPYLAAGVLSPRQCLWAALEANNGRLDSGKKGVTTWISQLIWREFYRHVLIGFPRVCMNRPFRLETDRVPWRCDEQQYRSWCQGRTGVPIVDAGMRQLAQTGWMHNRLRMIVAMFLTKDLFIDWRWGERHFMRHLVDGDFASNNGGWQWSASTGTDAAPYFRIFNPISQSRRFDRDGEFIRRFVPELGGLPAEAIHEPHSGPSPPHDYPKPIVDRSTVRERVTRAFRRLPRSRLD